VAAVDWRAVFGGKIGGVENILDADRQAAQRACRERRTGGLGATARAIDVEHGECPDLALVRRNGRGAQVDHGGGMQLVRRERLARSRAESIAPA
jgi:hypothetical protein